MHNCFICNTFIKRKSHYLCKSCYEQVYSFYSEVKSRFNDMDNYAINVLNGSYFCSNQKVDYIVSLWHLLENYDIDDFLNLLLKNNIVLQNVTPLLEVIDEKESKINELKEKINTTSNNSYQINSNHKNKSILCEDGHIVKSNPEFRIDQFLYKNGIVHAYEKTITLKDGSQIHPDFYIPAIDTYIEYHGVKGSSWYNKMNKYKDNIFKIEQITVIVIDYKQEEQIEQILPILLNMNGLNKTFK